MNVKENSVLTIGGDKLPESPFGILAGIRNYLPKTPSAIMATSRKKKTEKNELEPEADFSELAVKVKPSENFDAEAVKAEAKKRSEAVFRTADDYFKIRQRIAELQAVDGIELIAAQFKELRNLLAEQVKVDNVLARQPESIKNQFTVDLFLCEMKALQPQMEKEVLEILNRTIIMGRARKGTRDEVEKRRTEMGKNWPGHVYFRTSSGEHINLLHILSQMPGREGQVSNVDRKIFYELRSLIRRFITRQNECAERVATEEVGRITEILSHSHSYGLSPRLISEGKEGYYTLYIPNDSYRPNNWGEGAGIVQVLDLNRDKKGEQPFLVIRAEDGAGCMKSWREENKGKWVALHIYKRYLDKELAPASIKEAIRVFSLDFCKKLFVATGYAVAQEKKRADDAGMAEAEE